MRAMAEFLAEGTVGDDHGGNVRAAAGVVYGPPPPPPAPGATGKKTTTGKSDTAPSIKAAAVSLTAGSAAEWTASMAALMESLGGRLTTFPLAGGRPRLWRRRWW
ncbi:hypothetical protein AMAG_07267 [Allomyces macrogynus ATCC 38327]|uniref:Uncharacterized protein n=1 Tax=Allomyces macrogynus (strain ATCC 38327) TaxID=578462 RepID=A0A0L0SHT7_ALLM3|nr:hypothetical protein AMAG_07267 [Allomyces macrogynus ATCC 38327]|eukprot:KNE62007.1 hypothetical protein AMAG_07267 [Allomyces macrogynus ATCC 38327]